MTPSTARRVFVNGHPWEHIQEGRLPGLGRGLWPAHWIAIQRVAAVRPLLVAYRCRVTAAVPGKCVVHVSADERYELYLDGTRIGRGPERGDVQNWYFESYELDLPAGEHVLVARVWSLGGDAPYSQISTHHGLIVGADPAWHEQLATGVANWEAKRLGGLATLPAAGGTGARFVWDGAAMDAEFAKGGGTGWEPVLKVRQGKSGGSHGLFIDEPGKIDPWLRPGGLQPQRSVVMGLGTVRHVDAVAESDAAKAPCTAAARLDADMPGWQALAAGEQSLTVPANTRRRVIFDLGRYSCAYPLLVTRGGKGTVIAWNWLESLYLDADPNSGLKGDRGSVEDKFFRCKQRFQPDVFRPGGSGVGEHFSIPWWRAGRYAQLTVATAAEPVTLVRLAVEETGYPLNDQGAFDCSDSALLAVLPLCQRTLETCCHETYMDCPYYEQQQWVGDTRVQALIGYALTLDDAPQRKVISLLGGAQVADGWVPAFYPVRQRLSIPSFTLTWIGMLTDYAWWRGNADFVRAQMPSVRRALDVFCAQRDPDGLLRLPPGWHFVDWVRDSAWQGGGPPPHGTTPGALLQWWAVYALREVARVESWLGEPELAARWQRLADELAVTVMRLFWRAEHGLFSEDTAGHHFCEHTQALAVLAGATLPAGFGATLLARRDLAQVGLFFTHYLFEAYARLGLADALWQRLDPWRGLAGLGLFTVPETIEPTRSDTHAWSAHPLYHARVSLLGIRPAALGFERVRIAPQPGSSAWLAGAVPHPKGLIQVSVREGNVKVSLPPGLAGELIWAGKTYPLSPGDFST